MHAIRNFAIALLLSLAFALPALAAPVNINTANALTLTQNLKGVGPSKAQAIVAWRSAHGRFHNADDLAKVKGIGLKTVERNRNVIRTGNAGGAKAAHAVAKQANHK